MNNSELREWLNYHEAAYPGYLRWMQQAENGGDTVQRDRMALWASRVRNLDKRATKEATEKMFATEIHEYKSDVGRYEIAKRHEQGGRLKLAKLIEEFGWKPEEPKAITHEQF